MKYFFAFLLILASFVSYAQPAPKDAPVDVTVVDAKSGAPSNNEIIIFRSRANNREYQGLTDANGKFSLR
ncbi:MAG: hypothetical protein RLY16_499, partial [Bacteroidota bacterium]